MPATGGVSHPAGTLVPGRLGDNSARYVTYYIYMNELENQYLEQYLIHKSVVILIVKGAFAWLLLALFDFAIDQLPLLTQLSATYNLSSTASLLQSLASAQSLFHLVVNALFGWLILYTVLSWFFEYYIINSDSIIVRKGIIFTREDVYQMEDVKSIDVAQGFWGKLFRIGTLEFYAFRMRREVYLRHIADPFGVAALIHRLHPSPAGLRWPGRTRRRGLRRLVRFVGNTAAEDDEFDDEDL